MEITISIIERVGIGNGEIWDGGKRGSAIKKWEYIPASTPIH